jgi:hypothetical protein
VSKCELRIKTGENTGREEAGAVEIPAVGTNIHTEHVFVGFVTSGPYASRPFISFARAAFAIAVSMRCF